MYKLIKEACKLSFNKTWIYRFEVIMLFVHVSFEVIFMLVFWSSINNIFDLPMGYGKYDIYLYTALSSFAMAISDLFFGINILPYIINEGVLDTYIVKPQNTLFLFILENMNVITFLEKFFLSIVMFIVVWRMGAYNFEPTRLILAIILLIIGAVTINLFYLLISLLSFFFGLSGNFRTVIDNLQEITRYPLGFFSNITRIFFLTILPFGLVSYYPLEILLERRNFDLKLLINYLVVFLILSSVNVLIAKKGFKRYESNN